ncbi:hypothetical protein GGH15_002224 [Coemansia sp. RSA 562]|nr:hypothetical protein GGH15_002224 [Coemansia sp. RSA 562]
MSQSELSRSIEKLGAADDWEGVWKLINGAWTSTTMEPDTASMQQLIDHALAKKNGRQAVRLAQKLSTIISCNRLAANAITDEWIVAVLCSAVKLTNSLAAGKKHPFVDFSIALFSVDVMPDGPKLDRVQFRVLRCADRLLARNSARGAASILAELNAATAKYVVPLNTDSEQVVRSVQGPKWTYSTEKHGKDMSYPDLKKWYIDAVARRVIPTIFNIRQLLIKAQKHGDHEFWETVISKDFPKLMDAFKFTSLTTTTQLIKYYKKAVWSLAISTYASRKDFDKVIDYFGRIINAGTFPASDECIELLKLMEDDKVTLPVLPMGRKTTTTICGMKPAYMPQSTSTGSKTIDVESPAHRAKLIAQMGLAMLYSSLQHKEWPTDYFYGLLLGLLARAQMIDELQHVFTVVMPAAMSSVPADILNPLLYETGPLVWVTAIQAMSNNSKFDLAKQWFDEYRADVLPKLCEQSSSFAKRWSKLSGQSRLAILAEPYYAAAQITRPLNTDGTSPTPWYNLQQVEWLLELDQLREQDKLTRPFEGVIPLLQVFTHTDEYLNVDKAEALIKNVGLPYSDTKEPQVTQPENYFKLAWCYRMMVDGHLNMFLQQKKKLGTAFKTDSGVAKTKERIIFWFKKLDPVRTKALQEISEDDPRISFTKEQLIMIHKLFK